ncbi:GFA family protein [Shewanella sp. 1CM18E]|uniref:GFA family protein n=1 Tax=Shewanella sp. 1CM18E TaxID=2929169 RepID=UPI0020C13459|nr:GFA family protein [Shewanella sp. 1CM18E]MCK8044102.1 GFA family protein [Shewanella sp. 1CM18E]
MLQASCSCGQLSLSVTGNPSRVSVCHCHACQKRTGSAFGVQARFPNDCVTVKGHSKTYQRMGDSGSTIRHFFCPECGNTLWFTLDAMADVIAIPLGNFSEQVPNIDELFAPTVAVYQTRCHQWVTLKGISEIYD